MTKAIRIALILAGVVFGIVGIVTIANKAIELITKVGHKKMDNYERFDISVSGAFEMEVLKTDSDKYNISILDHHERWAEVEMDINKMEIVSKYTDGGMEYFVRTQTGVNLPPHRIRKDLKTGKLTDEFMTEVKWVDVNKVPPPAKP